MLAILTVTAPIYLCILAGWLLTRIGLFQKPDMDVLGRFVLSVALPCMLFVSLVRSPIGQVVNPTYAVSYGITSLVMVLGGYFVSRILERTSNAAAAFDAMGMGGANTGFVGFPMMMLVLPGVAGMALGMNVLVENLITIPLVLFLAARGEGGGVWASWRAALGRLVRMPLFHLLVVGLVVSAMGWHLPPALDATVDIFGRASAGVALFSAGGMLVGLSIRGHLRRVGMVTFGKLVVMPALALASWWVVTSLGMPPLEHDAFVALLLMAAMPSFTSIVVFSSAFGQREVPAAVLLTTTTLSFVTLTALMAILL